MGNGCIWGASGFTKMARRTNAFFGQYALAVKNTSTDDEILYGDLTGDGKVNLDDAYLALKAAMNIVTLTDEQKEIAGVALEGNISLDDVKLILRKALRIK